MPLLFSSLFIKKYLFLQKHSLFTIAKRKNFRKYFFEKNKKRPFCKRSLSDKNAC
jgi:hypothetical protein